MSVVGRLQGSSYKQYLSWLSKINASKYKKFNELNHAKKIGACRVHIPIDAKAYSMDHLGQMWIRMMGASKLDKNRIIMNSGVRDTMKRLLNSYKHQKWLIPDDVYPVYQLLAQEENCVFYTYKYNDIYESINNTTSIGPLTGVSEPNSRRNMKDVTSYGRDVDVILVTDPTPFGKSLTGKDIGCLLRWVKEEPQRRVVVDAVYSHTFRNDLYCLLETDQAYYMHSLSKTHALPWHLGVVLTPLGESSSNSKKSLCKSVDEFDPQTLSASSFCISTYPNMGKHQAKLFRHLWEKFQDETALPVLFSSDSSGPLDSREGKAYLTLCHTSNDDLMRSNLLGVPYSIYDSDLHFNPSAPAPETNGLDVTVLSVLDQVQPHLHHFPKSMYHVTRLSNFCKGFDKYSLSYNKHQLPASTFPNQFHLLFSHQIHIGLKKVSDSCLKHGDVSDYPLILETETKEELHPSVSGVAQYIDNDSIIVTRVGLMPQKSNCNNEYDSSSFEEIQWFPVEEIYAKSMRLLCEKDKTLANYSNMIPRSISILPVAQGCQAKCPFCFSHSSISEDLNKRNLTMSRIDSVLLAAKKAGAQRAVVTGGGEPTVTPIKRLLQIIESCRSHFPTVTLISNGYSIGTLKTKSQRLALAQQYQQAGLTVLAVSRHGVDCEHNTKIMNLDTKSELIGDLFETHAQALYPLRLRWVCVLQKGGVDSVDKIKEYLDWVSTTGGCSEICFKELYVSSSEESLYHNNESNAYSRSNQVSLSMVTSFLIENQAVKVGELPWGSPIYGLQWTCVNPTGKESDEPAHITKTFKIAAYTEPTVYWERQNNICRSWNLMADGDCYASLETKDSIVMQQ